MILPRASGGTERRISCRQQPGHTGGGVSMRQSPSLTGRSNLSLHLSFLMPVTRMMEGGVEEVHDRPAKLCLIDASQTGLHLSAVLSTI